MKTENKAIMNRLEIEYTAADMLQRLGVPANFKGYVYLKEAITACVEDDSKICYITKILYPDIAKKYHTNGANVERTIRHAVTTCWDRQQADRNANMIYLTSKAKPTNAQFISIVSENVKAQLFR